ncbi:MAG: esterase, partial [Planctomycetes bacterium]|nr:esterase [Planctomycetota bacterium]
MSKLAEDPRIDPRIKNLMGMMPAAAQSDAENREQILAEANTPEAQQARQVLDMFMSAADNEDVAPSDGLDISVQEFTSQPDGNTIKVQLIRPTTPGPHPCVYYIHGGGMMIMSCFDGIYKAWGRIIAAQGVAVAMVDFRNCMLPSSAEEVAPYPARL